MGKFIDLTGKRFEKLLVIKRENNEKNGTARWLCKCDCGNEKIINSNSLTKGLTRSCGCLKHKIAYNFQDLTGLKFNRLTVIERAKATTEYGKKSCRVYWLCECDCGKKVVVGANELRRKHTNSCGCYHTDLISSPYGEFTKRRVFNAYKNNAKIRKYEFLLSKERFFELTSKNCFYCNSEPNTIEKNKFGNGDFVYNGIDRIDSSKGYIEGNIVTCCSICNIAKHKMGAKEFLDWVEKVYNHSIKDKK